MKKTLEIIRYELTSALGRKSYLFVAFGIPILAVVIFAGINLIRSGNSASSTAEREQEIFQYEVEGYVDKARIVSSIPEDVPDGTLRPYPSESAAKDAMENGEITAYYVIPADYIDTGDMVYVHPDVNPIAEGGQNWVMIWTLYFNLLDGNTDLASKVWSPANYVRRDLSLISSLDGAPIDECSIPGYTCESNELIQLRTNIHYGDCLCIDYFGWEYIIALGEQREGLTNHGDPIIIRITKPAAQRESYQLLHLRFPSSIGLVGSSVFSI